MKSILFRINVNDFIKGLIVVVLASVLGMIEQALMEHGLSVSAYDWGAIFNVAMTAGGAYLTKNFLSDDDGKVLGGI